MGHSALAGWLSGVGVNPKVKDSRFNSQSGHMPGLWAPSPVQERERQPIDVSLLLFLPPFPYLSKNKNLLNKKKRRKNGHSLDLQSLARDSTSLMLPAAFTDTVPRVLSPFPRKIEGRWKGAGAIQTFFTGIWKVCYNCGRLTKPRLRARSIPKLSN